MFQTMHFQFKKRFIEWHISEQCELDNSVVQELQFDHLSARLALFAIIFKLFAKGEMELPRSLRLMSIVFNGLYRFCPQFFKTMFDEEDSAIIAKRVYDFRAIISGWERHHLPEDFRTIQEQKCSETDF